MKTVALCLRVSSVDQIPRLSSMISVRWPCNGFSDRC